MMKLAFAFGVLFGLATAQTCMRANPPLDLPTCTDQCLVGQFKFLDGTCADNLAGFCALSDYVRMYFGEYGTCLLTQCTDDGDRYRFVSMFKEQCESLKVEFKRKDLPPEFFQLLTKGPPSSSKTSAMPTSSSKDQPRASSTTSSQGEDIDVSLPSPSPQNLESQSSEAAPSATPNPAPPATSVIDIHTTISTGGKPNMPAPNDPATSQIGAAPAPTPSDTTHSHHSSSSSTRTTKATTFPLPKPDSQPGMGHVQIAGAAAGGTAFLAVAIGVIFYLLRRRKRSRSQASTPGSWDPSNGGHGYGKATLPEVEGRAGEKSELCGEAVVDRYASMSRNDDVQSGVRALPLDRGHGQQYQSQHPAHTSNMRFNNSPYPELNTHSPPPTSPASTLHEMNSWHSPTPPTRAASELHTESMSVGSPVSELGAMSPLVGVERNGDGRAEMHGEGMGSPVSEYGRRAVELSDNELVIGRGVELDAVCGQQARARYYDGEDGGARGF